MLGDDQHVFEIGAALVVPVAESVEVGSVELPMMNREALVCTVLVGQAQQIIVRTVVLFIVTTSAVEAEMKLRVHPISIGIEERILLVGRIQDAQRSFW